MPNLECVKKGGRTLSQPACRLKASVYKLPARLKKLFCQPVCVVNNQSLQVKMARISCVIVFVLCLFAVEAFPKARRGNAEKAFVLYRIPASRCLDAPEDDICDFGYKVRNYNATIVSSLGKIESILSEVGVPEKCIGLITKLNCRNVYPECLSNGMLDYGDQHGLIDEIVKCAPYLIHAYKKDKFLTGIHNDPYASYHTLNCINIPQDPGKLCPKPQYSVSILNVWDRGAFPYAPVFKCFGRVFF